MRDIIYACGELVAVLSGLIITAILAAYFKLPKLLKILAIYLVITSSIEICAFSINQTQSGKNLYLLHLSTLVEFVVLWKVYHLIFIRLAKKISFVPILVIGIVLILANSIFLQPLTIYNSYSFVLVSLFLLTCAIVFFAGTIDRYNNTLEERCLKWILIGIFIAHAINVIVMLFSNVLLDIELDMKLTVWLIRAIVLLITKLIILFQFLRLLKFYHLDRK